MSQTTPHMVRVRRRTQASAAADEFRVAAALALDEKLRQASVWPSVKTVGSGGDLEAPHVVELDPTSFCDLACPGCISTGLLNQTRFDGPRLRALAREIARAGVRAVILIGGGEPLMHSATGDVIRELGEAGVSVGLTTNGTNLTRFMTEIAEHSSWTRVSVDAATEATFGVMRPGRNGSNKFADVIRSMRMLASLKRGTLGFSFLLATRHALRGSSNAFELVRAAELARDIGCDYFEVKPEYDQLHFLKDMSPSIRSEIEQQLPALAELNRPGFRVIAPRTLNEVLAMNLGREHKAYETCPITTLRTLVTASGAYVCPYHRGNSEARYGDPLTTSFEDLWRAPERRQAQLRIDPRRDCQFHCIRHQSNLTILGAPESAEQPIHDYDPFI